jgi:prepilin-type N-terminal cleavage/methylation domain-containing protein
MATISLPGHRACESVYLLLSIRSAFLIAPLPTLPLAVKTIRYLRRPWGEAAFTLVEMAVVIAILLIVMTAGIGLRTRAPAAARRTAVDLVSAMADRARTMAIARRSPVVMALAHPSDLPAGEDGRCRIGLFQVVSKDGSVAKTIHNVTGLGRWMPLDRGIAWKPGKLDGAVNPWDSPRLTLRVDQEMIHPRGIVFDARGGISSPPGSASAVILIGESGGRATDAETQLRIGRVTGRIYQSDR